MGHWIKWNLRSLPAPAKSALPRITPPFSHCLSHTTLLHQRSPSRNPHIHSLTWTHSFTNHTHPHPHSHIHILTHIHTFTHFLTPLTYPASCLCTLTHPLFHTHAYGPSHTFTHIHTVTLQMCTQLHTHHILIHMLTHTDSHI